MLEWKVFVYDVNDAKIKSYNIFEHYHFRCDLVDIKNCEEKEVFAKEVKASLLYYFWGKCQWEIVLQAWPPSKRLDDDHFGGEKVDVFSQVMLNWDRFIDYLWKNKHEIRLER